MPAAFMVRVQRMKAARLVVLSVAIAAGGFAALLAGRSEKPPEVKTEPVAKVETVDVLVARSDIPMGQTLSPGDVQWQQWPASASSGNFIRKNNRPQAIEDLSGLIARVPFVAGEPIREAKLVNAKGSGFMAAILPTGMRAVSTQISPETGAGGFILPNDRVDVILSRRDKDADKARRRSRTPAKLFSAISACWRSTRTWRKRTARRSWSARPRRSSLAQVRPRRWCCRSSLARCRWRCAALPMRRARMRMTTIIPASATRVNIVRFGVSTTTTPR